MTLVTIGVAELETFKIRKEDVAYSEFQFGWQRNKRYTRSYPRVRLGLQTSPENFFYDETAFAGAPYVYLKALEFTMLTGDARTGVYDLAALDGAVEMWDVTAGTEDALNPGTILAGSEVAGSALKIFNAQVDQVEIKEGDTYTICDQAGAAQDFTTRQIHISLKSHNKPGFTFYEWHPQAKYRFNRDCNIVTDTLDDTLSVAYMGDNNYVLSPAQFAATATAVGNLA